MPGYDGRYIINPHGTIRRVYASCIRDMFPSIDKSGNVIIRLSDGQGNRREHKVSKLVAAAFKSQPKPGMVLYHVNGMKRDNYVGNLEWIDRRTRGKKTGAASRKRAVVKVDTDGEIQAYYSSARAAGRENHMSYQTVLDYCNGKVNRQTVAPDGFVYRWEDEVDTDNEKAPSGAATPRRRRSNNSVT